MDNFRLIDPKAFNFSSPQEKQIAQALVQKQQPQKAPQQPMKSNRPSQEQAQDVGSRFAAAYKQSQGGGIGGFGGGIAALVLAGKNQKMQEAMKERQIAQEDLQMEAATLQNQRTKQQIDQAKVALNREKGLDALSRLETNTSDNLIEDVQMAGGEMSADGRVKTHLDKVMELQEAGQMPYDVGELAKYSPGLINRMNQKYSRFTSDQVIAELNEAAKRRQETLSSIRRLNASSRGSGSGKDALREDFKAWSSAVANVGRITEDVSKLALENPQAVSRIMTSQVLPMLKTINDFGVKKGVVSQTGFVSQRQMIEAMDQFMNGDPSGLQKINNVLGKQYQEAIKLQNRDPKSPARVKETKAPPPVAVEENVPNKKEEKKKGDPRLSLLGVE